MRVASTGSSRIEEGTLVGLNTLEVLSVLVCFSGTRELDFFYYSCIKSFIPIHDLKGLVEEKASALCSKFSFNVAIADSKCLNSEYSI